MSWRCLLGHAWTPWEFWAATGHSHPAAPQVREQRVCQRCGAIQRRDR